MYIFVYKHIDDFHIFSEIFEEHLTHWEKLPYGIYDGRFHLILLRCNFAGNSIKYLAHSRISHPKNYKEHASIFEENKLFPFKKIVLKDWSLSITLYEIINVKRSSRIIYLFRIQFWKIETPFFSTLLVQARSEPQKMLLKQNHPTEIPQYGIKIYEVSYIIWKTEFC